MCSIEKVSSTVITALSQEDERSNENKNQPKTEGDSAKLMDYEEEGQVGQDERSDENENLVKTEGDSAMLMDYEEACGIEVELISQTCTSSTSEVEISVVEFEAEAEAADGQTGDSQSPQEPHLGHSPTAGSPRPVEPIPSTSTRMKNIKLSPSTLQPNATVAPTIVEIVDVSTGEAVTLCDNVTEEGASQSDGEGKEAPTAKLTKGSDSEHENAPPADPGSLEQALVPVKRGAGRRPRKAGSAKPVRGLTEIDSSGLEIFQKITQYGSDKLFDEKGYAYTSKKGWGGSLLWRCCVRSRKRWCTSMIKQVSNGKFYRGSVAHNHLPTPGAKAMALLSAEVRSNLESQPTKTAQAIVQEAMKKYFPNGNSEDDALVVESLMHAVRARRRKICDEPTQLRTRNSLPIVVRLPPSKKGRTRALPSLRADPKASGKSAESAVSVRTLDTRLFSQSLKGLKEVDAAEIEIIKAGTRYGSDKLIDAEGYGYTGKLIKSGSKLWRCVIRSRKKWCNAYIKQDPDGRFYRGSVTHDHPPKPNERAKACTISKMNRKLLVDSQKMNSGAIVPKYVVGASTGSLKRQKGHQATSAGSKKARAENGQPSSFQDEVGAGAGTDASSDSGDPMISELEDIDPSMVGYAMISRGFVEIEPSAVEIIKGVSVVGSDKLFDIDGFAYTAKSFPKSGYKMWRCTLRRHNKWCNAMIKEDAEGRFFRGSVSHNHPPKEGVRANDLILADAKMNSVLQPTKRVSAIVREAIEKHWLDGPASYKKTRRESLMTCVRSHRRKSGIPPAWREDRLFVEPTKIDRSRVQIIPGGSKRGTDKLIDSEGFTYTCRRTNKGGSRLWRCSLRRDANCCSATIKEDANGNFETGSRPHEHAPNSRTFTKTENKTQSAIQHFVSLEDDLLEARAQSATQTGKEQTKRSKGQSKTTLTKNGKYRSGRRKIEPESVDFELDSTLLPLGFSQKDVRVQGARHMLFATAKQLEWLQKADVWYVDVNRNVKQPFEQLLSIHAFFDGEEKVMQLPLIFCIMSRQQEMDYTTVLQEIVKLLPAEPDVVRVVAAFKRPLWDACRRVLPDAELRGCAHHYRSAILGQIEDAGLQEKLLEDGDDSKTMKKLAALCYLPPGQIVKTFEKLEKSLTPASDLEPLFEAVEDEWVDGDSWLPVAWSVFNCPTRTAKEVEGWLEILKRDGSSERHSLYPLLQALHRSSAATFEGSEVELVTNKKLKKHQKQSDSVQGKIFQFWDEYLDGQRSARKLLQACSKVNDPE